MENLIIFIILVTLGYTAGSIAEKKHYKSIIEREKATLNLPAVPIKNVLDINEEVLDAPA